MVYLRAGHAGRRPSYLFGLNACHVHVHGSFIRRGRGGAASRALWLAGRLPTSRRGQLSARHSMCVYDISTDFLSHPITIGMTGFLISAHHYWNEGEQHVYGL
jgi:hypothetical protein